MNRIIPSFVAAGVIATSALVFAATDAGTGKCAGGAGSVSSSKATTTTVHKSARHARLQSSRATYSRANAAQTGHEKHSVGDGAITTQVKTKLLVSSDTSGTQIHVRTQNGVVTLAGNVGSRAERMRAEQIARSVHGVKLVRNNLIIYGTG